MMKSYSWVQWARAVSIALLLVGVLFFVSGEGGPPQDFRFRLNVTTTHWAFNFFTWEVKTIARKLAFGALNPQRFMDEDQRARFVLDYLDQVREASQLTNEISRAYSNPEIGDPAAATQTQQDTLNELRAQMQRSGLVAEAILGEQVGSILRSGGFGMLAQILPPVSSTFTPLPYLLVISPREIIQSIYQRPLVAGLTAANQDSIEQEIESMFADKSAYVTGIGGLAAYPAMLLESSSIDWVSDTVAHEWSHHYLVFYPLGFYYDRSGETRTLNETAASLMGDWAGQEIILRFYAQYLNRPKHLPNPLTLTEEEVVANQAYFDFGAEMHLTRVTVDQLLADGKIEEAEAYMEERRRYFVANGYRIRRLNQAYFAFHGAYASTTGAAGKDPIGPAVRQAWALSATPREFLHTLGSITTLAALETKYPISAAHE
ncbi:MAG: hypothetical protein ACK2UQ_01605 [Anaerolineae bacterium]